MTIIVPYRDREEHLKEFIPAMNQYKVYIIEQTDDKPFNRGKLINVGYLEIRPLFFVAHDIDMIPVSVDYYSASNPMPSVVQLVKSEIQKVDYLGGVTYFNSHAFRWSGGYHNDFWHRAEDNEMMFNLKAKKFTVLNRFGIFKQLPHERNGPEFIPELWDKAQLPRTKDMLKTCEYKVISIVKSTYTHIKVEL